MRSIKTNRNASSAAGTTVQINFHIAEKQNVSIFEVQLIILHAYNKRI